MWRHLLPCTSKVFHIFCCRLFCSKCPATFTQGDSLKAHENSHLGLRPYRCTQCTACFASAIKLNVRPYKIIVQVPKRCSILKSFDCIDLFDCSATSRFNTATRNSSVTYAVQSSRRKVRSSRISTDTEVSILTSYWLRVYALQEFVFKKKTSGPCSKSGLKWWQLPDFC